MMNKKEKEETYPYHKGCIVYVKPFLTDRKLILGTCTVHSDTGCGLTCSKYLVGDVKLRIENS